jgi:hypothetical protein
MRLQEFANTLEMYLATVRVVPNGSSTTLRTTITADSLQQAKTMLTHIYGVGNVISVDPVVAVDGKVTEETKTLSPQELQVKSLSDKAKQYKDQAKQMKAQNAMKKAQANLLKATAQPSAS